MLFDGRSSHSLCALDADLCAASGESCWRCGAPQPLILGPVSHAQAIEGNFVDKKCPFTGNVAIRGRILTGTIATMKMKK